MRAWWPAAKSPGRVFPGKQKDGGAKSSATVEMTRQDKNEQFLLSSFLYGGNADYIDGLYARYKAPLATVIRAGVTPKCVAANGEPRRPKPVITSSKMSRIPCLSQIARSRSR